VRIFLQGKDESVIINGDITVTVLDIDGDEVLLAIDAPECVEIDGNEPSRSGDEMEEWSPLQPR
jgi:carbon storage regulator CsrA